MTNESPPRGWHRYDPTCECAGCERGEPSSPYLKVHSPERPGWLERLDEPAITGLYLAYADLWRRRGSAAERQPQPRRPRTRPTTRPERSDVTANIVQDCPDSCDGPECDCPPRVGGACNEHAWEHAAGHLRARIAELEAAVQAMRDAQCGCLGGLGADL